VPFDAAIAAMRASLREELQFMKIADQQQEHAEPARECAHEYGSR
jgi:hypothetical protein